MVFTANISCQHFVPSCFGFCRRMMEPETWGDQCVINSLSLMWSAKINVITAHNFICRETRFRAKDAPLGDVDFVLIFNGRNHYSVASKITFQISCHNSRHISCHISCHDFFSVKDKGQRFNDCQKMLYSKGGFFTFADYCKDSDPDMAQSHVEQRAVCIFFGNPGKRYFVPQFVPHFVPLQFEEARDENKRVTADAVAKAIQAQKERWDELVKENQRLKAAKLDPRQPILNETQMKWLQQQSAVVSAEKQRDQMKKERDEFAAKANRLGVENLRLKKKVDELKKVSVFRATIRDNIHAMIRATNFLVNFRNSRTTALMMMTTTTSLMQERRRFFLSRRWNTS